MEGGNSSEACSLNEHILIQVLAFGGQGGFTSSTFPRNISATNIVPASIIGHRQFDNREPKKQLIDTLMKYLMKWFI